MFQVAHGTTVVITLENGLRCSIDNSTQKSQGLAVNKNIKPEVMVLDRFNNIITSKFIKDDGYGVVRLTSKELIQLLARLQKDGHKVKQEPYNRENRKKELKRKAEKQSKKSNKFLETTSSKGLVDFDKHLGQDIQLRAKGTIQLSSKVQVRKIVRALNQDLTTQETPPPQQPSKEGKPFKLLFDLKGGVYAIVFTTPLAANFFKANHQEVIKSLRGVKATKIRIRSLTEAEAQDIQDSGIDINPTQYKANNQIDSYIDMQSSTNLPSLTEEEEKRFKAIKRNIAKKEA